MKSRIARPLLACSAFLATFMAGVPVLAEESTNDEARLPEIIVTAQKRAQSVNDVGLTIQTASGEDLQKRGIQGLEDLPKLVPGLTYTKSIFSTPVFTLRGVGLYDATWGASPAVAVYTDQVPRNFPVMSDALDLDIQRVEVLKGPQGTLFGQSSTGGAVNYILNKPTKEFEAGASMSVERFDRQTFDGFISGPLSDTVRMRFAARGAEGGKWQTSATRPYDENGAQRKLTGRITLDWTPSDSLSTEAVLTASRDRSDVQAPQYAYSILNIYSASALAAANANPATRNPYGIVNNAAYDALTNPASAGYRGNFLGEQSATVALMNGVHAPTTDPTLIADYATHAAGAMAQLAGINGLGNSRIADWTPGRIGAQNNSYLQGSIRVDFKIADNLTLTSLTAVAHQKLNYGQDLDATPAAVGDIPLWGTVRAFNQELHLSGNPGNLNWIVGANYDDSSTSQNNYYDLRDYASNAYGGIPCSTSALVGVATPCQVGTYGGPFSYINITENNFDSKSKSYAGFANADFKFTPNLSAHAGVRYTKNKQEATYCYNDPAIDLNQGTALIFSLALENPNVLSGGPAIKTGQCFPIGDGLQGTTKGLPTLTPLTPPPLEENNTSYRVGFDYKFDQGTLVYVDVSQGYKAGIFSEIGASATSEYLPATQEKLVDYELGFKAPLFDRRLNINGAAFYYQYSDKQVRGRVNDPVYGLLEKMINVPKSRVIGAEADIQAVPVRGLRLTLSATYLKSKVTSAFSATPDGEAVYNAQGFTGDFKDSELPFTPKFSGVADGEYEWSMGKYSPFIGATVFHQGAQNATFQSSSLPAPDFVIDGYTTLDLRAGVRASDNKWTVTAYARNITSKYYFTSVNFYLDTYERFTGQPAVYGLSAHVNF
jgi:outer membrane receptor protein involved in Fe transport